MDTNPVAGDDEHIDANIFWPALKRASNNAYW